jgi:hypothetical protein
MLAMIKYNSQQNLSGGLGSVKNRCGTKSARLRALRLSVRSAELNPSPGPNRDVALVNPHHQAIAVPLDLVHPFVAGRDLGPKVARQGSTKAGSGLSKSSGCLDRRRLGAMACPRTVLSWTPVARLISCGERGLAIYATLGLNRCTTRTRKKPRAQG